MDFFEAQARAKKRSGRLVLLFILAVAGTIAATYGAALLILRLAGQPRPGPLHPDLLGAVAGFTLLVCVVACAWKLAALRAGGPAVAEHAGGRRIHPGTTELRERVLLNVVEEMALASGLPAPAVFVLPDEHGINAFAAGYSPADAAVAVTEGALARLDRDELQGVVAHEFSHILNGDMRLNTRLSALVFGILALSVVGRVVLRSLRHARVSGSSSRRGGKGGGGIVVLALAIGLSLLVIGYIGHLFGRLIQAAVSRQREYLADAAAVQFTRNPSGIAGALKKLCGSALAGRMDAATAGEISHFCFAQNFRSSFGGLFATHPPLDERIRAIEPTFDGRYLASTSRPASREVARADQAAFASPASATAAPFAAGPAARLDAAALIATAGQFSAAGVEAGRAFLATLPDALREAAHDPASVAALGYALCLPRPVEPERLEALLALIASRADPAAARRTRDLHTALDAVPPARRLPLLQVATPALRELDPAACATLLDTLDALVHADGTVSPHEFALQKILARTLGLVSRPRDAVHVLAPRDVAGELSVALSAAARLDAADEAAAARAFARAATEFNGLHPPLAYQPAGPATLDALDAALEHLAHTPAPFRKRILFAFARAFTADGRLAQSEADLLRAFAAVLDCPIPPVLPVSP